LAARHERPFGVAPPKPERKVLEFVGGQPIDLLHVSAVTLAESGRSADKSSVILRFMRVIFATKIHRKINGVTLFRKS